MEKMNFIIKYIPIFAILSFCLSIQTYANSSVDKAVELLNDGKYNEAIVSYDSLIAEVNNEPSFYYGRGMAYYYTEKYSEAENDFRKAIDLDKQYADGYLGLSMTLIQRGNDSAALVVLNQSLANSGVSDEIYYTRGLIEYMQANYIAAIGDYTTVLANDANNADALYGRAIAYYKNDDYQNAEKDFNRFLTITDNTNPLQTEAQRLLEVIKMKSKK
jgi:tetratricopeptide (TPR) repeat protein